MKLSKNKYLTFLKCSLFCFQKYYVECHKYLNNNFLLNYEFFIYYTILSHVKLGEIYIAIL